MLVTQTILGAQKYETDHLDLVYLLVVLQFCLGTLILHEKRVLKYKYLSRLV